EQINAIIEFNKLNVMKQNDGKKVKRLGKDKIGSGVDANLAGTANSKDCVLFICEGASASKYIEKLISMIDDGTDYFGFLPIRGKILNVVNADAEQYINNKEITTLKNML